MGNKERIQELKDEIRRLEAEEQGSVSPRLEALRELVTRTGYFRTEKCFYKTADDPKVSCDEDGYFSVDFQYCIFTDKDLFRTAIVLNTDGTMYTFEPELLASISESDYLAAKALYESVRSQVSSFISQYCKDDGQL